MEFSVFFRGSKRFFGEALKFWKFEMVNASHVRDDFKTLSIEQVLVFDQINPRDFRWQTSTFDRGHSLLNDLKTIIFLCLSLGKTPNIWSECFGLTSGMGKFSYFLSEVRLSKSFTVCGRIHDFRKTSSFMGCWADVFFLDEALVSMIPPWPCC